MPRTRLTKSKGYNNAFGAKLRSLRLQRNLQQKELADLAGVHPIQYGRYERGDTKPTTEVLKRLATALGVTYDYLLSEQSEEGVDNIFGDAELLQLFNEVARFPDEDKMIVKKTLEAFVIKRKVHDLAAG